MIYNVAPEIEEYFIEQYNKVSVEVVPGHWPKMRTKEDVDLYIKKLGLLEQSFKECFDGD